MPSLIPELLDDICSELLNKKQYDAKAVFNFALSGREPWHALERYCSTQKSLFLVDFCSENSDSITAGNKILKFQVKRLIDLLGNSIESLDLSFILSDNYTLFVERLIDSICEAQSLPFAFNSLNFPQIPPHFYALKHLKLCITDKYRFYYTSMYRIFDCCSAFPSLESFDLFVKDLNGIPYPPVAEIVAEFYNFCDILSARNYKFSINFTWHIFLRMDKLFKQLKGEFDGFELSSDKMILPIYTKTIEISSTRTAILKFKFY